MGKLTKYFYVLLFSNNNNPSSLEINKCIHEYLTEIIHGCFWLQRVLKPHNVSVDEDLNEGAREVEVIASVSVYAYILFWFPCKVEASLTVSMFGFKGTNEGKYRRIVGS